MTSTRLPTYSAWPPAWRSPTTTAKAGSKHWLRWRACALAIHLTGPRVLLAQRMAARQGHYMPASLLDSQLATLEAPGLDEQAIVLDADTPIDTLVQHALAALQETAA
jgi:carbohydrate kinase (thermoresistant glucokinase family)